MKRFTQCVILIIVLAMCLAVPVSATEEARPWASSYFTASGGYLWKTSSTSFQVWFDVQATGGMTELGVSEIYVQYRPNTSSSWKTVQSYYKDSYGSMIAYNTGAHSSYVTYNNASAHGYYRAHIVFYAKNSTGGRGYYDFYTDPIYM